jgi:hypothetical protein
MARRLPCQSPRSMAIFAIYHLPIMPRDGITHSDAEKADSQEGRPGGSR